MLANEISEIIDRYMQAFNANDLDAVMTFFSDEAIYEPGDGNIHRGKAAVRAAFEPQFHGAMGSMRFDETDRLIDAAAGRVAIRWTCRHDLSKSRPVGFLNRMQRLIVALTVGTTFGWRGVDIIHFDSNGEFGEKYTYACYGAHPHLQRSLA